MARLSKIDSKIMAQVDLMMGEVVNHLKEIHSPEHPLVMFATSAVLALRHIGSKASGKTKDLNQLEELQRIYDLYNEGALTETHIIDKELT
jgi:hypothetical protein